MLPTKEAVQLTSHAKATLSEYEMILNKDFVRHTARKILRIPGTYDVFRYFPAGFYYRFRELYPEIDLILTELPYPLLWKQLDENEAELALASGPFHNDKYASDFLFSHRFCLIMNEHHPLARKTSITIEDLRDQPTVVKEKNTPVSEFHTDYFVSNGIEPNIVLEVTDYHVICQMAREQYAVGMVLDYLVPENELNGLVIRPFADDSLTKTIHLVRSRHATVSNEAAIFREYLLNWLKEY